MATKTTKPKPKPKPKAPTLKQQADKLAAAEYAGIIGYIKGTREGNRNTYETDRKKRWEALASEVGSNRQTSLITANVLKGLRGESTAALTKALGARNAATAARDATTAAQNSENLANFEAELKARGLDPAQNRTLVEGQRVQQDFRGRLSEIERTGAEDDLTAHGRLYDALQVQNARGTQSAEARSRAMAQADLSGLQREYTTRDQSLSNDLAKVVKDKGSSALNTYLTLKKEKELREAEQAQAELAAAVSMGKQASADYFRQAGLDQRAAESAAKNARADRELALKEQKFLADVQRQVDNGTVNWARIWLNAKKAGIELPPEWAGKAYAAAKKDYSKGSKEWTTDKYYDTGR